MEVAAHWLVSLIGWYLLAGLLFGIYFVAAGAGRIDPSARHTTWGFKLIILPGVIALWPVLLTRLLRRQVEPPAECNAHRRAAGGS